MTSLRQWLDSIGLGQYEPAFLENAIDVDVLPELTEGDLEKLGIPLGHRKRLIKAIRTMAGGPPSALVTSQVGENAPGDYSPMVTAERRHLTVMICDLVDSTALSAQLDPEDLGAVIDAFQTTCARITLAYDGFLADFRGDGILAYFGYPRAHEDDAERTVRAGLDIAAAVARLKTRAQEPLSVRIGIATGLVVVGDLGGAGALREHTVVGDTPSLAARLQALAEPGTVVVAASTRRLLGDLFYLRNLGFHTVEGIAEPIAAWAVDGMSASESRFEAVHAAGLTDLVGREDEIDFLLKRQRLAWKGEGQIVLISGEPGIGKSRLAAALEERIADEPHTNLRYQCSPHHANSALYPFIAQLERAAGFKADDTSEQRLDKLEAVLAMAGSRVQDTAPLFAALLSIPFEDRYPRLTLNPAQQRRRTLAALLDHFENLARQKPILLLFEDAHWADATSLELLNLTVERVRRLPVLALFTLRPEFEPPWVGLPNVGTLTLGRLDRNNVESIVKQVTGGRSLPTEVMNQIVAKTDGNPLFVEELTKAVLEGDIMVKDADGYRLDGPLPPLAIPATLQDSLMARLDRMAPVKEIGQIGAAIGREFSYSLMREVAGRDETALKQALARLEEAELVFRRGEPPEAIYSFKHALVRDAAYESLLKSGRKQLHARIAAILAKPGNIVEDPPEVLAHHFMEAGEVERAAHYWFQAAKHAGARYANHEAMAHCTKALAALSHLSRSAERTKMELGVRIILADGLRIIDRHSEALTELNSAEAIAIGTEHVLELSRIHHMRGNIYYFLGKSEPCLAEHEAAWNFAKKTGSIEDEARALGGLGDANFLMGRIHDAHQKFDHCIKLSRANELFITEVAYLPMRAVTHMYSLRFDESIDDCNATIDLVKRIGQARGELIARSTSSWIFFDKCELHIAEHHAQKGLEAVNVIGSRRFIPLFNDVVARIRLLAGDRKGALEVLEESWNISREASIAFAGPLVLGAIALATDDPKRRSEALKQGEAILREGCASHNHFRFYRDAIEVSLREHLWDGAKYYANVLEGCFGAQSSAWSDFIIARGRALAEARNERPSQQARARLQQLRDHALSVGMRAAVPQLDQALGESVSQL